MESLWTQPPQPLPGPVDHPFFRWIAEGAKKDPALLASMRPPAIPAQSALPVRAVSGVPLAAQPRAVYPFVPPPSVGMEPITPDVKPRQSFIHASPSQTTPDLSSSPTESSPASVATATSAGQGKQPMHDAKDNLDAQAMAAPERDESVNTTGQPTCTSAYLRVVTQADGEQVERRPAVFTGQIWRSGSSKDEGWRRHQWSTEES